MYPAEPIRDPYQISQRLHRALQTKALMLEVDALRDELAACTIENPDQLRRQRLLIQAQRDEAERLRDFLTRTSVRPVEPQGLGRDASGNS
jgi:hypothetical protein